MDIYTGTSGYSYKEWQGVFYPEKIAAAKMLAFYAERLSSVEINNTFYRLPRASVLEQWRAQVPASFRFSIKASRRITHLKRLKEAQEETGYLLETLDALGASLGVVLFQLPPFLRKDCERLASFLELVPPEVPATFEFRHPSWFDEEVYAVLRARNAALCLADAGDDADAPRVATADWGYLRLRRDDYDEARLADWAACVAAQDWRRAFVFFKHEDAGAGPRLASAFAARFAAAPG